MSTSTPSSAALPTAFYVLRILIVLNWLGGAAIAVLLLFVPHEQWIMTSLGLSPSPEADRVVLGLRAIAVIGLITIPLSHAVLKRLVAIVETVRAGDPFVAANALRLRAIAWVLFALQTAQPRRRRDRQGRFDSGASARHPGRLFDQRLARRAPHVPAGTRVRGRHAHARRPRRDGVTWRSRSSSTTFCTIGA